MTISEMYRKVTNAIQGLDNEIYNIVVELEPNMVEMQRERLFEGKLSTQEKIVPEYRPFTIFMKRIKGQPTDRVTLFDEGLFYDNIFAKKENQTLIIESSDSKFTALQEKYGEHIFGLTTENKQTLREKSHQRIVIYVKSKIQE